MYDMTEMNKLEQFLKNNGVVYDREYRAGGEIIKVYDSAEKHDVLWDAIINDFSYGRVDGLLEIYGSIVDKEADDSVEGWLTAEDVIKRYQKAKRMERCKNCAYLIKDVDGNWCCDAFDYTLVDGYWEAKHIEEVADEDCPNEQNNKEANMKDGGRVLEFNVEDLKHLKNYLTFAWKYVTDVYHKETDADMAKVERLELEQIHDMYCEVTNFLNIFG